MSTRRTTAAEGCNHQSATAVSTIRLLMNRSDALAAELGWAPPLSTTTRYSPVIVLPGPFPLMPVLTDRVAQVLKDDSRCEELRLSIVDDVAVLTAGDFEYLIGTAAYTGRTLIDLIDAWRASELKDSNWRTWAGESIPGGAYLPGWLMEGGREGIRWGARQLFRVDQLPVEMGEDELH